MSTEQEKGELEQLMPPGLLELLRTCPIPPPGSVAWHPNPPSVIILPDASEKPGE